ncbi:holo-ACP synthase [Sulfuriflexus sp.]|uniref:holo-ACP synthase n=1 Tax=Sulfuriflexus sp. TaxID=2015443 RepID=UPI0028CD7846|nr:holo-ACP synthase [Sulfuriflexus sp.]MDT8404874.1 holo-ACP synthase [Sulfuriflexus sp.]
MIYGVGTDIVRVARMQDNLQEYGDKFARRILSDNEFSDFSASKSPAHFLAKRFAAKEATAKAMGIGFSRGLSLSHIGVGHDENGKPVLEFSGRAVELCNELGIGESYISIADEEDHAVAFVTLLAR